MNQIGLGGSCHWCTEAIFQSLKGVSAVQQGWIASEGMAAGFSEAVLVYFDPGIISEATLIAVHLHTHSCTSSHAMRTKYRSAVYTYNDAQATRARETLISLQAEFNEPIITTVLPFRSFRLNRAEDLNYYYNDPEKPFCKRYISPKLKLLKERFNTTVDLRAAEGKGR